VKSNLKTRRSYDFNLLNDGRNSYAYDAEGRIVSLNGAPTYVYDAEGRRVAKAGLTGFNCNLYDNDVAVTNIYLLDLADNQVTELGASGIWNHSNVWAGGRLLATYGEWVDMGMGGHDTYSPATHPNGDVLSMTDSVMGTWSYTYDDFNRLTSGNATAGVDSGLSLGWTYDLSLAKIPSACKIGCAQIVEASG
jgi:YD repeat-containing protein